MTVRGALVVAAVVAALVTDVHASLASFGDGHDVDATFRTSVSFGEAPTVKASTVVREGGSLGGSVRPGGTYRVFADLAAATGTSLTDVRADLSTVTSDATGVSLEAGTYAVGATTYTHRSAVLTADVTVSAGTRHYRITATAGVRQVDVDFAVTVDVVPPTGVDVQTANGGAAAGTPEAGDSITFTFNEPVDPGSVLPGWTGAATDVTVVMTDGGLLGADRLSVQAASGPVALGSVDLVGTNYVSANRTFGGSGTASTMTMSGTTVTVRLGTPSGSTGLELVPANMRWTAAPGVVDAAGNDSSSSVVTEADALVLDVEF